MLKKILWIIFFYMSTQAPAPAQDLNHVYIFGYVKDSISQNGIPGVWVEAINESDSLDQAGDSTDQTGGYVIDLTVVGNIQHAGDFIPEYFLSQNYPNPFNPSTIIPFNVPEPTDVKIIIFDVLGKKVNTLLDQKILSGQHYVYWNGRNERGTGVSTGIYFYQLRTRKHTITKKMILLDGPTELHKTNSYLLKSQSIKQAFKKFNDLFISLSCKSRFVETKIIKNIHVTEKNFRYDISISYKGIINRDSVVISDPGVGSNIYISGKPGAINDQIQGTEKIVAINSNTLDSNSMRVDYNGAFTPMRVTAETGDEIVLKVMRGGDIIGFAETFIVKPQRPPVVIKSKPTHGEKDIIIKTNIFVYFSEAIDPGSINEITVTLTDQNEQNVPGEYFIYNDNKTVAFNPKDSLELMAEYTLTVNREVLDIQGIPLEITYRAIFNTGFPVNETRILFSKSAIDSNEFNIEDPSLFTMDIDGTNLKQLTKLKNYWDVYPDYSPDGRRIVFNRMTNTTEGYFLSDIYIMNRDGTYPERLTNTYNLQEWSPAFSPDGQKIIFSAMDSLWNSYLFTMDINGQNLIKLTDETYYAGSPDWSPDGANITFISGNNIYIMDRDGGNIRNISEQLDFRSCGDASWSPDGEYIAFSYRNRTTRKDSIGRIEYGNLDFLPLTHSNNWFQKLSWSPDSRKIVYITLEDSGYAIGIVRNDGLEQKLIIDPDWGYKCTPEWAPVKFE